MRYVVEGYIVASSRHSQSLLNWPEYSYHVAGAQGQRACWWQSQIMQIKFIYRFSPCLTQIVLVSQARCTKFSPWNLTSHRSKGLGWFGNGYTALISAPIKLHPELPQNGHGKTLEPVVFLFVLPSQCLSLMDFKSYCRVVFIGMQICHC